jgi:hypothetical protein
VISCFMDRTISLFRTSSMMEEKEWKSFRNSIDKSDRKIFDRMFSLSHIYNSTCSYSAVNPVRICPIFMSIILHHYKQLKVLRIASRGCVQKRMNNFKKT